MEEDINEWDCPHLTTSCFIERGEDDTLVIGEYCCMCDFLVCSWYLKLGQDEMMDLILNCTKDARCIRAS